MSTSPHDYIVLILVVAAIIGGIYLLLRREKAKAASTTVANATTPAAQSLVDELKAHVTASVSSVESNIKQRVDSATAVIRSDVAKLTAPKVSTSVQPMPGATAVAPVAAVTPVAAPPVVAAATTPAPAPVALGSATVAATPPAAAGATSGAGTPTEVAAVVNAAANTLTITTQAPYAKNPLSNTPDWRVWTDTSPGGYPEIYELQSDGKGGSMVVPGSTAMLLYAGQTFPTEAAIAGYKQALIDRATANAIASAAMGSWPAPQYTAPPAGAVATEGWALFNGTVTAGTTLAAAESKWGDDMRAAGYNDGQIRFVMGQYGVGYQTWQAPKA